jgi:hypothetical protein
MKILIQFFDQDKKSEIITPFIALDKCIASDDGLVVPGLIKIDYSKNDIKCFCLGLDVVEKILSNICNIQVDSSGNSGLISFPRSLSGVMLETQILDFQKVLELAGNGTVEYVNTDKKSLKANVLLSQWLSANLVVAPTTSTTFAVAGKVKSGTITSSEGPISKAINARCNAAVPLLTAIAFLTPRYSATNISNSSTFLPWTRYFESITFFMASNSSCPMSGCDNLII